MAGGDRHFGKRRVLKLLDALRGTEQLLVRLSVRHRFAHGFRFALHFRTGERAALHSLFEVRLLGLRQRYIFLLGNSGISRSFLIGRDSLSGRRHFLFFFDTDCFRRFV